MPHNPGTIVLFDRGVVVIDEDGEAQVFETFEAAAATFRGAGFRDARLIGEDASARLRSLLDMPTPPVSPDDAPKALMARIRAFTRSIMEPDFPDMGATVENSTAPLTLAALRTRNLDDHRTIFGLLAAAYSTFDPEECAGIYDLIAEEATRLAANERQAAADEAEDDHEADEAEDDHEADEAFMLHADFRRTV